MDWTYPTGFGYIAGRMHGQEEQIDSMLVESMQQAETQGIQGLPVPYQLRSDGCMAGLLLLCFLLFAYTFAREKKYIFQRLRRLFLHRKRNSLFDDIQNPGWSYPVVFPLLTCIFYGLFLFCHLLETCPAPVYDATSMRLCVGMHLFAVLLYSLLKWGGYSLVNWVFFDRERNDIWLRMYTDVAGVQCFLLFPVILFIIYALPGFRVSLLLVLLVFIPAKILLFYRCFRNFFSRFYGFLHFILYFCALEIVPLLLLIKGIPYVNQIVILNF